MYTKTTLDINGYYIKFIKKFNNKTGKLWKIIIKIMLKTILSIKLIIVNIIKKIKINK